MLTMFSKIYTCTIFTIGLFFSLITFSLLVNSDFIDKEQPIIVKHQSFDNITVINDLVNMSIHGDYWGENRKSIGSEFPIYTQTSSFLFYNRKFISHSLMWDVIAMGIIKNIGSIISDKKTSIEILKSIPEKFEKVKQFLPNSWSDSDTNFNDIEDDSIYVFKPSDGDRGNGIVFFKGNDLKEVTNNTSSKNWIVQDFIEPFLYNGRKNHLRTLTLVICRSNGTKEFYMFKQMKVFLAVRKFERELIFDKEFMSTNEATTMLLSNLHVAKKWFLEQPENTGKKINAWDFVLDASKAFGERFEEFSLGIEEMHSAIYDTIGHMFQCSGTGVSVYNNSCFHIIATDVAIDSNGKTHMLEMNTAMGIRRVWKNKESHEFTSGASCLIGNGNETHYHSSLNCDKWINLSRTQ